MLHARSKYILNRTKFIPLSRGYLEDVISNRLDSGAIDDLKRIGTPQYQAFDWLHQNSEMGDPIERLQQRYALATLFFATQEIGWKNNTKWLTESTGAVGDDQEECGWFGIVCDQQMMVTDINLPSNNLQGGLPSELTLLASSLTNLALPSNSLTNRDYELDFIGDLINLVFLDISSNYFRHQGFPETWKKLISLQKVKAQYNVLTGEIGDVISYWPLLTYLDLESNDLTGAIPPYFGSMVRLEFLYLSGNTLSSDLSFLRNGGGNQYKHLWLDKTTIQGPLFSELGSLPALQSLSLRSCGISGEIPTELGLLQDLEYLGLKSNNLSGTIPKELGRLQNLKGLEVQSNGLGGSMPGEICSLVPSPLKELRADCQDNTPVTCTCCTTCL
eukprot:CAMPEP_0118696722 /NCGR_PEP_ID=MMETSP0800-20121206/14030_1 /TAXON_ID=210618 ORGANISM="Striatella unipunctata, Strain CCMP2910" /NCGR_SAMPLE_ID=MMETSP0800 /ASSEMBLY_ACC=CAM_ASM_000638 /LENGTH=387 /DNA_ID=CAMNT_0006595917 /DNA_START=120 /DNA_END=1283 /DNA_ORIENTATION=-